MKQYELTIKDTLEKFYISQHDSLHDCYWFVNNEGDHVVDYQIKDSSTNEIIKKFFRKD